MSKRGEFLKVCMDKRYSYEQIMELIKELNSVTEEERETKAQELIERIENTPSQVPNS